MTDHQIFNITDGRHRYKPCPRCGATIGMGLSTDIRSSIGYVAVWCSKCQFRGPEAVTNSGPDWWKPDKTAFEGWNAIPRTEGVSPHKETGVTT